MNAAACRIVALDPDDDIAFARYAEIQWRAEEAGSTHPVPYPPGELRALLRDSSGSERCSGHLGLDEPGDPVVAGLIMVSVTDNLEKAGVRVWVEPAQRGRGYGSAMADALVRLAAADRRTTLLATLTFPIGVGETHPNRAFAAAHGFTLSNAELHSVLELPTPVGHLDNLISSASPRQEGYSFAAFEDDDIPDAALESYLDLLNALYADAPTGDVDFETGGVTPEVFRADAALLKEQGLTTHLVVAMDPDGKAAAYTSLAVPSHDPEKVFQLGTLVARAHRGHRLGMAVKARNLARLEAQHPDRRVVHTWTAASNTHMIAVNTAIGFRAVEETAEYVRRLDA